MKYPVEAIIFDLDGVLINSEQATFYLLARIVQDYGLTLPCEKFSDRVGKKMKSFVAEAFPSSSRAIHEAILSTFYEEYSANIERYIVPVDMSVDFIKKNSNTTKLALSTMSDRREVDKILSTLGIADCFSCILSSDDVVRLKPDPEIYIKTLACLDKNAKNCVVIEDSVIGALSAIHANIRTYILLNGVNKKDDFDTLEVEGFIESEKDFLALLHGS